MYRFALIGCGSRAALHTQCLTEAGTLTAACDPRTDRAEEQAAPFQASVFASFDELLQARNLFDLALVCTPNGFHAEQVIRLLQAGKDVVCEQPLCLTKAAAWQIVETEKFTRRKLHLVPCWEDESLSSFRELVTQRIGDLQSFHLQVRAPREAKDWKSQAFPGGGLLYSYFFGMIDLALKTLGPLEAVSGRARREAEEGVEDEGEVGLLAGGVEGRFSWQLSEGRAAAEWKLQGHRSELRLQGDPFQLQSTDEPGLIFTAPQEEGLKKFYRNLALSLQEKSFSNLMEGLPAVTLAEDIYRRLFFTPAPTR